MSVKVKTEKTANPEGQVLTFDNAKDYVAIKLKSDGNTYVEHRLFAEKLVNRKLAEYDKTAKLELPKPNTVVLDND